MSVRKKRFRLFLLCVVGCCMVSIPVTFAVGFKVTGASDLLTIGTKEPVRDLKANKTEAVTNSLRCVPQKGYYALTIDGGPTKATPKLTAALKKAKAVATFFDVGQNALKHPAYLDLQRRVGDLANNSYSYAHFPDVSQDRRFQEMTATAHLLDYPTKWFRPPYGDVDSKSLADITKVGLVPVYWTVNASADSTDGMVDAAKTVKSGGILMLKDSGLTAEAVPDIVAALAKRGMCPGTLADSGQVMHSPQGWDFKVAAVRPRA